MSKKNNILICTNIFKNNQNRKQIFTKKMAEIINQAGTSTDICKLDDLTYNKIRQTGLFLSNLQKKGDKI